MNGFDSETEKNYIKLRAEQGASSTVICTELEDRFNIRRQPEEIESMRGKEGALPPENHEVAQQANTTRPKGHITADGPVSKRPIGLSSEQRGRIADAPALSSATVGGRKPNSKNSSNKPSGTSSVPAVQQEYNEVSEGEVFPEPPVVKIEPRKIVVSFNPEYVTSCEAGEFYVYGDMGAVKCEGLEKQTIAGFDMELYIMRQVYGSGVKKQPMKILPGTLRKVAPVEVMEKILEQLEFGSSNIKSNNVPQVSIRRIEFFNLLFNSNDVTKLADLLCYFRDAAANGSQVTEMGDKIIKMIAAEHAVSTKGDFEKSRVLVSTKIGRTKAEEIIPDRSGRMIDPAP